VDFIDMYRGHKEAKGDLAWAVEPICSVLKAEYGVSLSVSGYYDFKTRPPSARSIRDGKLKEVIATTYSQNYSCYGVRKMYRELRRQGHDVARCTVARLMADLGLKGAVRGKVKRTTIAGAHVRSAEDLVRRNFYTKAPDQIWVADFTYVSTWEGWCYVAFVTDVFARRIIGHCISTRMNRDMVAAAFNRAIFNRIREGHDDLADLIHHNDKGSQYTADDFVELLASYGIRTSIGTVGDSYDNALAETINGAYKTELIKKFGPWRSYEELNIETEEWVRWYNENRINEYDDYRTPNEIEDLWYATGDDLRKAAQKAAGK